MPITGLQPMANPSASVSASRCGEVPCRSNTAAFRLIEFRYMLVIMLTVSVRNATADSSPMKLW
jgi:hypothetical protein